MIPGSLFQISAQFALSPHKLLASTPSLARGFLGLQPISQRITPFRGLHWPNFTALCTVTPHPPSFCCLSDMGTSYLLPILQPPSWPCFSSAHSTCHLESFSPPDVFSYSKEGRNFSILDDVTCLGCCIVSKRKTDGLPYCSTTAFERKTHERHVRHV